MVAGGACGGGFFPFDAHSLSPVPAVVSFSCDVKILIKWKKLLLLTVLQL